MSAPTAVDSLGWLATAVFVASYLCARPAALRRTQMVGALLWVAYGALQQAAPVVVANVLVLGAALWAERRDAPRLAVERAQP